MCVCACVCVYVYIYIMWIIVAQQLVKCNCNVIRFTAVLNAIKTLVVTEPTITKVKIICSFYKDLDSVLDGSPYSSAIRFDFFRQLHQISAISCQ